MRQCVQVVQLVVTFLLLTNWVFGATIKTKDGNTISGDIQGWIVLKTKEFDLDRKGRSRAYLIVQGKDIASLDERGLNTVPDAIVSVLVCSGSPTEDYWCLDFANDWVKAGIKGGAETHGAGMYVTMKAATAKNLTETVMGDLTTVGDGHVIVPALTITTSRGPIKLPVEEVIKPNPKGTSDNGAAKETRQERQTQGAPVSQGPIKLPVEEVIKPNPKGTSDNGAAKETRQKRQTQGAPVSQGVMRGHLLKTMAPVYPPLARQARVQGTVVLAALISKDGSIESLTLVSGHPMLVPAAIDAVKQWKYKPYLLNGKAVEVETKVSVNFALSGGVTQSK